MIKIKKTSWGTRSVDGISYDVEPLLEMVNKGDARLRAGIGLNNDILVEITPKYGDYYYRGSFNLTWEEFNQKYGKDYIDNHNLCFL